MSWLPKNQSLPLLRKWIDPLPLIITGSPDTLQHSTKVLGVRWPKYKQVKRAACARHNWARNCAHMQWISRLSAPFLLSFKTTHQLLPHHVPLVLKQKMYKIQSSFNASTLYVNCNAVRIVYIYVINVCIVSFRQRGYNSPVEIGNLIHQYLMPDGGRSPEYSTVYRD